MRAYSIEDYRRRARRRLPPMIFDMVDGGAQDEFNLRANRARLDAILLRQRAFVDLSEIRTETTILGTPVSLPLMVSPLGMLAVLHPSADPAVARAAVKAGSIFVHSAWSSIRLEEVYKAAPDSTWAQVFFHREHAQTLRHVELARSLGVRTIVVEADVTVPNKRERDLRHGLGMPTRPPLRDLAATALHPRWVWGWLTTPRYRFAHIETQAPNSKIVDTAAAWSKLAALRDGWPGKLVVKGLMVPEDAVAAVKAGADGIIVSNHGGRQFDSQPATAEVLGDIVRAVGGRAEVYVDGGIRRGADIVKVLALGAKAALMGRPVAFSLAAEGQGGVEQAFAILRDELRAAMGSVGAAHVGAVDASVLFDKSR